MPKHLNHNLPKYTFSEHFVELKKHLTKVLIWFSIATFISYYFSQEIFQFLLQPLIDSASGNRKMIYTGLAEAFFTYLSLSVFAGFILSIPIIALQIYSFISPGLYAAERRTAKMLLTASPILFIIGGLFVFYLVIPKAWSFFLSFEITGGMAPIILEARISEYLSLVIKLILAFGIAFQMPIILIILSLFGIVSAEMLRCKRRIAIVVNFIIAGIITPPDILSQISLAIPMILLYEFSIIGIDYFRGRKC
jgi:sec-independent protein translocase protein TatC